MQPHFLHFTQNRFVVFDSIITFWKPLNAFARFAYINFLNILEYMNIFLILKHIYPKCCIIFHRSAYFFNLWHTLAYCGMLVHIWHILKRAHTLLPILPIYLCLKLMYISSNIINCMLACFFTLSKSVAILGYLTDPV